MTIDELGGSTIILLLSCDVQGNCFVGEISVESASKSSDFKSSISSTGSCVERYQLVSNTRFRNRHD